MRIRNLGLAATFLLAFAGGNAWSQAYATINGTVTDPSGQAVVGAKIVVTNLTNGQSRTVTTNQDGMYVVPSLNPATYTVTV